MTDTPAHPGRLTPPRQGRCDGLGLIPAIAPLGLAVGVALADTSAPALLAWASAPLLVAGAAQIVLFTQLDLGSSAVAASVAALLVNARFVLYGAALAPRFAGGSRWFRLLAPHLVVDQTYALVTQNVPADAPDRAFRSYFTSAAVPMACTWTVSVAVGMLSGPWFPSALRLDLVLPVMFVALIVPGLRRRTEAIAVAAGAALVFAGGSGTGTVALAAVVGAVIGGWPAGSGR
jgi:predicted branched-subunit amino acid permease